ncbi:MAG TPA: hypothetical protein K8W04_00990 [Bacteroides reticulotermitis]|nr:hypothetical protein [Bacteroides reticulotermitis]
MGNNLLGTFSLINSAWQNCKAVIGSTPAEAFTTQPIYLFENHTGIEDADSHMKSTFIDVIIKINEMFIKKYPFFLHTEASDGQKHNNVLRNYYYRLTVTMYDSYLHVDYDIEDWNEETPWDKELE